MPSVAAVESRSAANRELLGPAGCQMAYPALRVRPIKDELTAKRDVRSLDQRPSRSWVEQQPVGEWHAADEAVHARRHHLVAG